MYYLWKQILLTDLTFAFRKISSRSSICYIRREREKRKKRESRKGEKETKRSIRTTWIRNVGGITLLAFLTPRSPNAIHPEGKGENRSTLESPWRRLEIWETPSRWDASALVLHATRPAQTFVHLSSTRFIFPNHYWIHCPCRAA